MSLESYGSGVLEGQGAAYLDARLSLDPGFVIAQAAESQKKMVESSEVLQSDVAYRGLSVRMVIATGTAERVKYHRMSRRMEYGGQVIVDNLILIMTNINNIS